MAIRIVPPAGPARMLAQAQLTNAIGDGAYYVTSALYFTLFIGLTPTQVGLGLTLGWAIGSVVGVPLGYLADRRGPRGIAVLLAVATGLSVASFLLVRSFVPFLIAACLYASCQCGLGAARQALLAGLVDKEKRTEVRAYLQSTVNARARGWSGPGWPRADAEHPYGLPGGFRDRRGQFPAFRAGAAPAAGRRR
ncbi:MFS transporter [Fodinicola feengrottensis]|uniref:MFS transporter n=1 Tax=Fodinicola feengrottensis TaxID=435914 RepID=UPI0024429712|nr:MFS transporter [Fodinicola feengrottensis]